MADASIPVDLFNPGQVFACLGFVEAADVLLGEAAGAFDWSNDPDVRFNVRAAGDASPIGVVLHFISTAEVRSIAPKTSGLRTEGSGWDVKTRLLDTDAPFPVPLPKSPAKLPAILTGKVDGQVREIMIDYWGDERQKTSRDNCKFWAGAGGYPGAAIARDALRLVKVHFTSALEDPFNLPAEQSNSFRFDWRRDYIPLDIGFSLNTHPSNRFITVGYPLVEMLAAIGLTNARPKYNKKLEYQYGVLGVLGSNGLHDPCFLRAALGGSSLPFPQRTFRMQLGWPGKENQARCITTVMEEIAS